LPIDAIKIDRAFVYSVDLDPRQRAIVRAVIQLAHVLDLDVIAEGIERAEQLDVVRSLGCDLAQGHHLSPPLPAEEMRDWIAARR
jgi:EAL domain-containing protein (putative c-di-GMP-specific phosphodiesterase class I)